MPPVPIYSNAPINPQTAAAKAYGVTPQTAAENNDQQQQGQAPQPTPTRTTATTTATFDPSGPPPPQPGAVPVPPTQNNPPSSSSSYASPPPPQPGAAPVPAPTGSVASPPSSVTKTVTETVTIPSGPPPQFSIPPPQAGSAFAPAGVTRSTSVDSSHHRPTGSGSTTINFGAPAGGRARGSSTTSLENPPGYTQRNPDGTAAERARLEAAAEQEKEEQGVWGSVKGFAGRVGEGLKKADQEAWRLVGGK